MLEDQIELMIQSEYPDLPPEDFEVLEENWQALQMFEACSTQIEYQLMTGQPMRMNYSGVDVVLSRRFPDATAEAFEQFQIIERVFINHVQQHLQSRP